MAYLYPMFISLLAAAAVTPLVIKLAVRLGVTDQPNSRKVHVKSTPSMGGLAIFIAFIAGVWVSDATSDFLFPILAGAFVIVVTGLLDDYYAFTPLAKLAGQVLAAMIVILNGVVVEFINVPFGTIVHLGWFGVPLTLLWILGITNAINLIDGLDGLAAGVTSIVLLTITIIAFGMFNYFVAAIALILLGANLGFLLFNFYPAKIFMGDTGSLFLGYMLSVISLLGFKNVTLFSLIIPVIILGVPISDTIFAIIRRAVQRKPLSEPDKSHLHHCLMRVGYNHRQTVLIIYGISTLFGLFAIMFSKTTIWGAVVILTMFVVTLEIIVEMVGLVHKNYRPLLNLVSKLKSMHSK
ncbi:glycosyltransferase family 4 protein [Fictibacillus aquaticus]|uniref:Undecaprenyl-phosphate alpha-N-acetylglucosaminyl 1-phosphate transferase n=1 Tax=Fictibacillus aquaticus TaxID=2021314 RepID=A0A235FF27_9BACL|nr:MraY family glycosyltransferase [Fictibacillus aquaticus]OYD59759.1 undecaprenyl-phosphate alpha-N-acetylglucosaminyl 1-phosphate transferase [Fictibacillus aquaticus]